MYVVKIKDGQTVAICSRKEDAEAYLAGQEIDKTIYVIEEVLKNEVCSKNNADSG